jgi:hypothetical protein
MITPAQIPALTILTFFCWSSAAKWQALAKAHQSQTLIEAHKG